MSYQVSADGTTKLTLNESDTVRSVLQNIAIILQTPKGSVPMYREFGLPMDFLDRPIPVAKTMMIAKVREAVERWEPRARVVGVSFSGDASDPSILIPEVEVEIEDE